MRDEAVRRRGCAQERPRAGTPCAGEAARRDAARRRSHAQGEGLKRAVIKTECGCKRGGEGERDDETRSERWEKGGGGTLEETLDPK